MICIRADGNQQIGTGHIMRCLSLADALREQGGKIMFVTAEPYFQRLIQTRGDPCTVLGTAYDRMEEELSVFLPLLEQEQPELVILDSYFVTPEYMKAIKGISKLFYIDDLNVLARTMMKRISLSLSFTFSPFALLVSLFMGRRCHIRRTKNISLVPDMPLFAGNSRGWDSVLFGTMWKMC